MSKRKNLSDLCYIYPRGTREGMPLFFWEKRVFVKHTNNHPNTPNHEVHPAGNARSPPSGQWLLMSTQRWEFFTVGQFQFGKITKWMNHKLVGYQFGSFTMGVNLKKVNRYLEFVTERMDLHHLGPRSFFWLLLLRVKRKVTHSQGYE